MTLDREEKLARRRQRYKGKQSELNVKRLADGICLCCGEANTSGKGNCDNCSVRHNEAVRKLRETRIAEGLCGKCGELVSSDHKLCDVCLEKSRQKGAKRRAQSKSKGLCLTCENPLQNDKCPVCKERSKKDRKKLKDVVYAAYGGYVCKCCGETEPAFLSLDHINDDGAEHRRQTKQSTLYSWLKKHKFPPIIQVLCMSCQWGKRRLGICPHQLKKEEDSGYQAFNSI